MDANNRILIVDDENVVHDYFREILPNSHASENVSLRNKSARILEETCSYRLDSAFTGEEAIQMVKKTKKEKTPYALAFIDERMHPGIDGIETISKIWKIDPFIEVVICTAYSDFSWDEIISKFGATDHLLILKKPFSVIEVKQIALSLIKKWNLNKQIGHFINNLEKEVEERTKQLNAILEELDTKNKELQKKNKLLVELSKRDSLTGLLNYAALHEELDITFAEAQRYTFPMSVVMMDIDYFKDINDNYGHQTGDEILKRIARILKNRLRPYDVKIKLCEEESEPLKEELRKFDISGRYGGDEFLVILPYCGQKEAHAVTERLYSKIKEIRLKGKPDINICMSIGIAVLDKSSHCDESKKLINLADKALYNAKSEGRDRISFMNYESKS